MTGALTLNTAHDLPKPTIIIIDTSLKYSGTKDNKLLFFDKTFQMDLVRH
jgi:hypothetical protein